MSTSIQSDTQNSPNPKNVLLLGASLDPSRYSYMCLSDLAMQKIPVIAVGLKEGNVSGIQIVKSVPDGQAIHTVTLYLGARNQEPYFQYILNLRPVRVIFNPGTENPGFERKLEEAGIEVLAACSIMMLHAGIFF
ncbi:MAG: CoA-binding protein [Bacteroidales bacterium]|nr:CoA-binding protein [Bacteroidales bacterium]